MANLCGDGLQRNSTPLQSHCVHISSFVHSSRFIYEPLMRPQIESRAASGYLAAVAAREDRVSRMSVRSGAGEP